MPVFPKTRFAFNDDVPADSPVSNDTNANEAFPAVPGIGCSPQPGTWPTSARRISSDADYDQIAFLPGTTMRTFTGKKGVFDFDAVVFPDLWQGKAFYFSIDPESRKGRNLAANPFVVMRRRAATTPSSSRGLLPGSMIRGACRAWPEAGPSALSCVR